MFSRIYVPFALLAFGQGALAQQPPTAGGQMQQIPASPLAPRPPPEIRFQPQAAPETSASDSVKLRVRSLQVVGAQAFAPADLIALTGFSPNSELSLTDLRAMAARITEHYRINGYFVAQAYLPAQEVRDNSVTIAVAEGRYGQLSVRNQSTLPDRLVRGTLGGLNTGDPIVTAPLESRLLLLSDLPGTRVRSTIAPGTEVGTSDLQVDIDRGRSVTGSIEADNGGNRYTGYYRAGGSLNLNNLLGIGDVASVRGLVTDGGLTYGRASYQAPIGALTLGVAYARLDYRLRREFAALRAHGSADIASVYASYPLLRSYDYNVYLLAAGDFKFFHDEIDSTGTSIDRRSKIGTIGLSGDGRDRSGSSFWSIGWSIGDLDIRTPTVRAIDAVTARTQGGFHKIALAAGRVQTITDRLSLSLAVRGQLASKNLDISEKMQLGGAYGVRAYPEGEGFGDQGYIATAEARLRVAEQLPGELTLFAFADHGAVTFNRNRFSPAPNSTRLSGAGAGIAWIDNGNFQLKASYAHRLGNTPVMSAPDASGQFWVQAMKLF